MELSLPLPALLAHAAKAVVSIGARCVSQPLKTMADVTPEIPASEEIPFTQ